MKSNKRSALKTLSWETFHLTVISTVIYLFTNKWEYASLGAFAYIFLEALGYFIHEKLWIKFEKK